MDEYLNVTNEPFTPTEREEMCGKIKEMTSKIDVWLGQIVESKNPHMHPHRNAWFYIDDVFKAYIRFARRPLQGTKNQATIDIGTVETFRPYMHRGVFTMFLEEMEVLSKKYNLPIFVENVMYPWFQAFFVKRGFTQLGTSKDLFAVCFCKAPLCAL